MPSRLTIVNLVISFAYAIYTFMADNSHHISLLLFRLATSTYTAEWYRKTKCVFKLFNLVLDSRQAKVTPDDCKSILEFSLFLSFERLELKLGHTET